MKILYWNVFNLIIICIFASFLFCYSGTGYDDFEAQENDIYEPNNTIETATLFENSSLADLMCKSGEYDYYKIPADQRIQITVRFLPNISTSRYGSCYISLYGYDFKLLESKCASATLPSILTFYSQKMDTIYFSVNSLSSDAPGSRYSMRIFRDTVFKNN